jgi:hypothetical protein
MMTPCDILRAVQAHGDSAVTIYEAVVISTAHAQSLDGCYVALMALERGGLIRSEIAMERGGKARRSFALTDAGVRALRQEGT